MWRVASVDVRVSLLNSRLVYAIFKSVLHDKLEQRTSVASDDSGWECVSKHMNRAKGLQESQQSEFSVTPSSTKQLFSRDHFKTS